MITNIDLQLPPAIVQKAPEWYYTQRVYKAVEFAETGFEPNKWIRTKVKNGSTAFGPVQVTGTLMGDYYKRYNGIFLPDEKTYILKFLDQATKFRSHKTDRVYGYGGTGYLNTPKDKAMYERVVQRIIKHKLDQNNKNLDSFLKAWRGKSDLAYNNKVKSKL